MDANKKKYKKDYLKFSLALVLCLLARLIPLRAPNVEPILATLMPFSRAYGALVSFSFAVLSILLYDVITGTLGVQTFFTITAYGLLGLWSASYFSAKGGSVSGGKNNKWDYVRFAIMGTLFYDALTGLTVGPIFFHQSFLGSLLGQIPFTALHLFSNIAFAFVLSPAIYNFLIKKREKKKKEKIVPFIDILNPKII
jgi:hypothetical protein